MVKRAPHAHDMPPWCFEAKYKVNEEIRRAWGCFEYRNYCKSAVKTAGKYGDYVGVKELKSCRYKR